MRSLLLLLVLLTGCAGTFTPPPEYSLMPAEKNLTCEPPAWSVAGEPMGLRQTVFLEAGGQTRMVQGLMLIDESRQKVQVMGMSEMGMKIFDVSVTRQGHENHFLSPVMNSRKEDLAGQIALSVRRIFLFFEAINDFNSYAGPESILMVNSQDSKQIVHECPIDGRVLTEAFCADGQWNVKYADHQLINGFYLPARITYHDRRTGYNLTLVLHEVFKK
jgi:hypothetical protein